MTTVTQMKTEFKVIEELGATGIKVLLYLKKAKKAYVRQILREAGVGYSAFYRSMYKLKKFGLVRENVELGRIRIIELTPKGEKLAEILSEADTLLRKPQLPE